MKRKLFFKNSLRNIDDELEEINPSKHALDFGRALPGEEVLGDLNDFEKKAFIWNSLMLDKMMEVFAATNDDAFYSDTEAVRQLEREIGLIVEKQNLLSARLKLSLLSRFDQGPLAFRGKSQVVLSKQSKEEIIEEIEKLKEAAIIEISTLGKKDRKPN